MLRSYSEYDHSSNSLEAEVSDLVRTIRHYDCLTRERLVELSGARHWHDHYFDAALAQAVKRGLIKQLSDDLFEIGKDAGTYDRPPAA